MNEVPAGQPDHPILEIRGITKRFPAGTGVFSRLFGIGGKIAALNDVSFSVASGETFGVLGETGAGKTTLAQVVSGAERPSAGQVIVDGVEAGRGNGDNQSRLARRVRIVGSFSLVVAGPANMPDATALASVGLNPFGDPPSPSADTNQRRYLAIAIHRQATVVVADEPATSRGATGAPAVSRLLPTLKQQHGWTVLVLSRDLATVSQTDRLAVLFRGRLVELGPTGKVIGTPVHPYTQAFMERGPHAPTEGKLPAGCPYHLTCPYVMDVCKTQFPVLEAKVPGHLAACHAIVPSPTGPAFRAEAGSARRLDRLRQREVMGTTE